MVPEQSATTWTRDELGEYHDGRGGLVYRGDTGWWYSPDSGRLWQGPFRTLAEAKKAAG